MTVDLRLEIQDSIETKKKVLDLVPQIEKAAATLLEAIKKGNKVLACVNGGSATDAQHFAGEFAGRYEKDRKPLPALALTANSADVTALANDYGYDEVFARQVDALGAKGDVLIAITTSGNSPNVLKAIEKAKQKGIEVIALTGKKGGKTTEIQNIQNIIVPSDVTARIQESHIMILHLLAKSVEAHYL
jgi:D-sedoheptulose 7-phosphate isomerase